MTDLDVTMAEAILGRDAEDFFASDLGRYMLGRAEQEEVAAIEEMIACDVNDAEHMERLQNIIWRSRVFKDWLAELVTNGKQAEAVLDATALHD